MNDIKNLMTDLYYYYEILSAYNEGLEFKKVIKDFEKELNAIFEFNNFNDKPIYLQNSFKGTSLIDNYLVEDDFVSLYQILEKRNYNLKVFIKNLIIDLVHLNQDDNFDDIVKNYLALPIIYDIQFDGKYKYNIKTSFREYEFFLASIFFDDDKIIKFMEDNRVGKCHENVEFLLNEFSDLYCITSLCKNSFNGTYYHSYSYLEEDDVVIDLCSNMVIKKNQFDDLFQTREIMNLNNHKARELYYDEVINYDNDDTFSILNMALYLQAKSLSKSEKKKIVLSTLNKRFTL